MNEIMVYKIEELNLEVLISAEYETLLLSVHQMSLLFDQDEKVIRKQIDAVFNEEAIAKENTQCIRVNDILFYPLEPVVSVGWRLKSPRVDAFRKWATTMLIRKGYVQLNTTPLIKISS